MWCHLLGDRQRTSNQRTFLPVRSNSTIITKGCSKNKTKTNNWFLCKPKVVLFTYFNYQGSVLEHMKLVHYASIQYIADWSWLNSDSLVPLEEHGKMSAQNFPNCSLLMMGKFFFSFQFEIDSVILLSLFSESSPPVSNVRVCLLIHHIHERLCCAIYPKSLVLAII